MNKTKLFLLGLLLFVAPVAMAEDYELVGIVDELDELLESQETRDGVTPFAVFKDDEAPIFSKEAPPRSINIMYEVDRKLMPASFRYDSYLMPAGENGCKAWQEWIEAGHIQFVHTFQDVETLDTLHEIVLDESTCKGKNN